MADAPSDQAVLTQLRTTLEALTAAQQIESTTQREIFNSVSDALGGAAFSSHLRTLMKAELDSYLVRLTQSQTGSGAAAPAKRSRKAAAPQRRTKKASSDGDDESDPSEHPDEDEEDEASESDFEETSGTRRLSGSAPRARPRTFSPHLAASAARRGRRG